MNTEQLERGAELAELIKRTEASLVGLKELVKARDPKDKKHYNDGQYWLNIAEHSDGSGLSCKKNLNRYFGNAELLDVIIETLENQVRSFKDEFNAL